MFALFATNHQSLSYGSSRVGGLSANSKNFLGSPPGGTRRKPLK